MILIHCFRRAAWGGVILLLPGRWRRPGGGSGRLPSQPMENYPRIACVREGRRDGVKRVEVCLRCCAFIHVSLLPCSHLNRSWKCAFYFASLVLFIVTGKGVVDARMLCEYVCILMFLIVLNSFNVKVGPNTPYVYTSSLYFYCFNTCLYLPRWS